MDREIRYKTAPREGRLTGVDNSNPKRRTPLSQGRLQMKDAGKFGGSDPDLVIMDERVKRSLKIFPDDKAGTPRKVIPVQSPHSRRPATHTELSLSDVENIPRMQSPRGSSRRSSIANHDLIARTQSPRRLSQVPGIIGPNGNITQSPSRRLPKVVKEVIVVEAFDDRSTSDSREVATRTFAAQSPARVICHSPSPKQDLLRQNMASKIDVDKPKGIYFGSDIEGGQRDAHSSGQLVYADSLNNESDADDRMSGVENIDDEEETKSIEEAEEKSDTGVRFLSPATGSKPPSASGTTTTAKKKKRYKPIQSRYKEPLVPKTDVKTNRTFNLSAITPHPGAANGPPGSKDKRMSRATSTPFIMNSMYEGQQQVDGSFLDQTKFKAPPQTAPVVVDPSNRKRPGSGKKGTKRNEKNNSQDVSSEFRKEAVAISKKPPQEINQEYLDLLHCRCEQLTFLNRMAEQTLKKQEAEAKYQLYKTWADNKTLGKEVTAMQLAVAQQKQQMAIDQLLQMQAKSLESITPKMASLGGNCSSLNDALHNVMQYIPLQDILIKNEGKLMTALDESRVLLAEISTLTQSKQPKIIELSGELDVLQKTIKKELEYQDECSELLAAITSLVNRERSLQVQLLQAPT